MYFLGFLRGKINEEATFDGSWESCENLPRTKKKLLLFSKKKKKTN